LIDVRQIAFMFSGAISRTTQFPKLNQYKESNDVPAPPKAGRHITGPLRLFVSVSAGRSIDQTAHPREV
ncbi:hypothetical protein, partial [Pseudomonas syringae group genomosp. 7]|uniref:hypothetical protein n=1 Tax=Pseudomonas syringae group genomosp. 7 TaxID=251699 RepID=UPI00376FF7BA